MVPLGFVAPDLPAGVSFSVGEEDLAGRRPERARVADSLLASGAFTASIALSLRLSLASFLGPSRRRFSSRRIFFLKFFSFMICGAVCDEGDYRTKLRVNDEISRMSRHYFARLMPITFWTN